MIAKNAFTVLAAMLLNLLTSYAMTTQKDGTAGYAPVNGISMYYEIHGKGTPLVLLHGGGSTIQTSFGTILPMLAAQYRVIAVELQAHGRTGDRDAGVSFEQDADDVAALLAYLKIDKAHFLGFSNGGSTAMQIGIRHPGLVNKLVVISAFYKRDGLLSGFFDGMQNASLENMPAALKSAYLQTGDSKGLQRMFEKDKERMLQFRDWSDKDLASIKAPVLLVAGDNDIVRPEHAVEMKNTIPNAGLMILPGIHGECIGEICALRQGSKAPEMTVAAIAEFLGR